MEILPGMTSWLILLTPIYLSIVAPILVAGYIIVFDLYWLFKSLIYGAHLLAGYFHMERDKKINWLDRARGTKEPFSLLRKYEEQLTKAKGIEQTRLKEEIKVLKEYIVRPEGHLNFDETYQVVVFPNYKEELEVLESSVAATMRSNYPNDKIIVVLAMEEREGEDAHARAEQIVNKYGQQFKKVLVTFHPDGIVGELKAKGANVYHAMQEALKVINEFGIQHKNVIVSTFDGDTQPSSDYFANLAYSYITNLERRHRNFQPVPLFNNNIYDAPALSRIIAFSSSFWQMIESTRPYRLVNFSAQAQGLETLVDIDFYDRAVVSDDSRQYFRAFFRYGGDFKSVPLFTPVYMDAVLANGFWATLKAQYEQKRRWAYGLENFPYFVINALKHKEIKLSQKIVHIYRLFEGHISWATSSLVIAGVVWLPSLLNPEFRETVFAYNLPVIARTILTMTWIGVVISTGVTLKLLPKRPPKFPKIKTLELFLQWILVPISALIFGSLPALDAETRLMLGRYMGFKVTAKKRGRISREIVIKGAPRQGAEAKV